MAGARDAIQPAFQPPMNNFRINRPTNPQAQHFSDPRIMAHPYGHYQKLQAAPQHSMQNNYFNPMQYQQHQEMQKILYQQWHNDQMRQQYLLQQQQIALNVSFLICTIFTILYTFVKLTFIF